MHGINVLAIVEMMQANAQVRCNRGQVPINIQRAASAKRPTERRVLLTHPAATPTSSPPAVPRESGCLRFHQRENSKSVLKVTPLAPIT